MKKTLLITATLACTVALYLGYQYSKTLTPESVMQQLFDMNAPARYAFVSDAQTAKLAVIDMDTLRQNSLLELQIPARRLAIHKTLGLLAYNDGGHDIIIRQLGNHEEKRHSVTHPVNRLQFDADSAYLIAAGDTRITLLDGKNDEQRQLDGYRHIRTWLYSPLARQLWILDDGDRAALYRYNLNNNEQTRYPLPENWHNLSAAAISPDEQYLLFGAETHDGKTQAVIWNIETNRIAQTHPLSAALIQPYIDNSGQNLIFIDRNGSGLLINRNNLAQPQPFSAPAPTDLYATGWLDTRLIAVGNSLKTYDLTTAPPDTLDEKPLPGATTSLFITADSKTALIASQNQTAISAYDLRHNQLQPIPLHGITQPQNLIMGAGNTLCH